MIQARADRDRRGFMLMTQLVLLVAMLCFASLAVDYGRVQAAKQQLRSAADAAAMAGAQHLVSSEGSFQVSHAVSATVQYAGMNTTDGSPVQLDSSDVQVGNWDNTLSPVFSTSRLPYNAVKVTACRQSSRGNAIPLTLARAFGINSCDIMAATIAKIDPPTSSYGIVGINSVKFSSIGVLARINGDIVSNGNINIGTPLGLLVSVSGDARSFSGSVSHGALAGISGSTSPLSEALNYPPVQLPAQYNNAGIAGYLDSQNNFVAIGYARIPAGTYVVRDLNVLVGLMVDLEGPVTFYVTGSFNMAVNVNLLGNPNNSPSNFNVNVANGGSVHFLANLLTPTNMNLYAPQSDIHIAVGVNSYTGMLIGKSLDINLPVLGTFNEVKSSQSGHISLVQ